MVPSGKLTLTTSSIEFWNERKWTDGSKRIEQALPEIVAEFLRLVTRQKQQRVEHEEQQRRRAEHEKRQQEIRRAKELQRKEFEDTLAEAKLFLGFRI